MSNNTYDAIVVGSGIGGLTCGAFLSRAGMRVLVLEKHTKIGGYAHSFKRRRFTFESGIHSVPMSENSIMMYLLQVLGIEEKVQPVELPSMYHFDSPDFSYTLPSRYDDIMAKLADDFPKERENLKRLVADMDRVYDTVGRVVRKFETHFEDEDASFVSRYHNRSIADYISSFISDERLRQVFYGMWPYAGMQPDRAPALFYIVMLSIHLFEGSHTLRGGFGTLADALAGVITAGGGKVKTRTEVTTLDVHDGKVRAAVTATGDRYEADLFVSNVSPYLVHNSLLNAQARKGLWVKRLRNLNPSVSCAISYLGLKADPTDILKDNITFWFDTTDPAHAFGSTLAKKPDELDHLVLLTTRESDVPPTLTLMNFLRADLSTNWKADKLEIADAMLAKADSLYPGLADLVELQETGSPTTFERYTGNTGGALYGFENDKDMYAEAKLPIRTYISNLYQTGHWGKPGGGVWNVMHNAYRTAKTIERDRQSVRAAPAAVSPKRDLSLRMIYPKFQKFLTGHDELRDVVDKHVVGDYTMPPSLALPILAALTPDDVDVRITDDNIGQPIDFDEKVDAVALSFFTPQASRAYAIADEFRKRGTTVIAGGIHPSVIPEEALQHADAVCVGEVEPVWDQILADLRRGELKRRYDHDGYYHLRDMPIPNRDIFDRDLYRWQAHLVLVSRGCPVRCGGCPIPEKEGTIVRLRPLDDVVRDIEQMPYKEFYITDDTVMLPGKKYSDYLVKLMERTEGMDINVFLASTMMMRSDPEFYRTLARGGAKSMYTVFGFDRASQHLFDPACPKEDWQKAVDLVRMNEDAGIHFFASYGVGFDGQDEGIFDRILKFSHDAGIDLAEFYVNTPFPGTPFGQIAEEQGRILHRNYDKWNTGNVVFKPLAFSEDRLLRGFLDLWRDFYADKEPEDTLRSFSEVRDVQEPSTPVTVTTESPTPAPVASVAARTLSGDSGRTPIKLKFVYPKFDKFLETYPDLAEFPAIAATWAFRMPPALGIPILANLLPPDVEWHVQDQNVEEVMLDDDSEVIAISYFTPQAAYAYELGDEFLKRGKTVLMGGMHPSMIPDDAAGHCTSLCVGEAEPVFARMLEDYRAGTLQPVYRADSPPPPEEIARPRTGIFNVEDRYDWHASLVSITRGCPFNCDWCNVPHYQGSDIRFRPMDDVVADIEALSGREFYVTDDMIMLKRPKIERYMMELCERIRDFDVSMFLSCSPAMNNSPQFLDAIAKAGAKSMYTVFASDPMSSRFYKRHPGVWTRTIDLVKQLEDRGIRFFGSFGVGFDCAGEDQFDLILEFCHKAGVKTAEFFIATPFPNTDFWNQIEREERFILPRDWRAYNCANVVFRPLKITEDRLRDGFVYLWREFFSRTDHEEALEVFHQKAENILRSREYSQRVKDAVARGIGRGR